MTGRVDCRPFPNSIEQPTRTTYIEKKTYPSLALNITTVEWCSTISNTITEKLLKSVGRVPLLVIIININLTHDTQTLTLMCQNFGLKILK